MSELVNEACGLIPEEVALTWETAPPRGCRSRRPIDAAVQCDEGELLETATCKEYLQVRAEGARQVQRSLKHYSLDMILAVGYLSPVAAAIECSCAEIFFAKRNRTVDRDIQLPRDA